MLNLLALNLNTYAVADKIAVLSAKIQNAVYQVKPPEAGGQA
jgi:hypothetical protein